VNNETKKCPHCNEEIKSDAVTCTHCNGLLEEKAQEESSGEEISRKDMVHIALLTVFFLAVNIFSFIIKHGKTGYLLKGVIGTGFVSLCVGFAFYLIDKRSPRPRRIKIALIIAAFFSAIILLLHILPK
jgi:hypothetical protein